MSLTADELTRRFGDKVAVDRISFDLPSGVVIGLLGPNGAGKTTTIRMAMGLLEPDSGTIAWNGTDARAVDRRLVGYLPEQVGVYERMPVLEHIAFFAELHGLGRRDARAAAARWAGRLDITEAPLVASLSKGNQQRVQLASALAHDPELVVLDEPFSGLDPIGQALVEEVIAELARGGATVVLSSHDLDRVERFCEHVALIADGTLRFEGTLAGLRARHPDLRLLELRLAEPAPELEQALPQLTPVAGDRRRLAAPAGALDSEVLLRAALDHGARVSGLATVEPSVRELFVREVQA